MAQLVQGLTCKHGDLTLMFETYMRHQMWCFSSAGEAETGGGG